MARALGEAGSLLLTALSNGDAQRVRDAAEGTGLTERQSTDAITKLLARGWVERLSHGRYRINDAGQAALATGISLAPGPQGPTKALRREQHSDSFQGRVWRSMRIRRIFTAAEVAADAMRDEAKPVDLAARYILVLVRSSYVQQVGGSLSSRPGRERRFRLIRDTGPLAPIWSRVRRELVDVNVRKEAPSGRS